MYAALGYDRSYTEAMMEELTPEELDAYNAGFAETEEETYDEGPGYVNYIMNAGWTE